MAKAKYYLMLNDPLTGEAIVTISLAGIARRLWLTERTPYRFRPLVDTWQYRVVEGDTLEIRPKKRNGIKWGWSNGWRATRRPSH